MEGTWEYYDEPIDMPYEEPRPRDAKTDEAKARLSELFEEKSEQVFYGRQVEVLLEKDFYHWITSRTMNELVQEGKINSKKMILRAGIEARYYMAKGNRYWKRQAKKIGGVILEYSKPQFTRALGQHGELMFDAALPTVGFMPKAKDVTEYKGKKWTKTEHDLDRVFERDGEEYGTEIKNTLDYIPVAELDAKLEMCNALGLRPLFIVRWAPKSYIKRIIDAGGIGLLFEYQMYPFGYEALAKRVQRELGLRVDCPRRIADGTMKRLLKAHRRQIGKGEV